MRLLLLLALLLPLSMTQPSAAQANPISDQSDVVIVTDTFDRVVSSGWGRADQGGDYTAHNPAAASVSQGRGVLDLGTGHESRLTLPEVAVRDVGATALIDIAHEPEAGNGVTTSLLVRGSTSNGYLAKFRHDRHNRLTGSLSKVREGGETIVVGEQVLLEQVSPGQPVHVEVQAVGTTSVALSARAWHQGTTRPAWQITGIDSHAAISAAGFPGIYGYVSSSSDDNVLYVDNLSVYTTTADGPQPPPAPVPPPAQPGVGSLPVGQASYPIPSDARYVTASNGTQGDGTLSNPYRSLGTAIGKSPSGTTLVLRGGTYHESALVPFYKSLTIQNYPGEAVWLDGSEVVSGWQRSGARWYVSDWHYDFDSRVSMTQGQDETHRFVDPDYPMAGHPDQVWTDGASLEEVGALSEVVPGTFFVDTLNDRLFVGSDPIGRQIRASTLQKGLQINGTDTTVRGIGVRRYATTMSMLGAVSTEVDDITLENVVITQNATIGLHGWNDNHTFNRVTITRNGMLGLGHNSIENLSITNSVFADNNREHFNSAPSAAGVKMTRARNVTVQDNVFADNINGAGLWFDHESSSVTVTGNTIRDNGATGLMFEASDNAVIADNYLIGNKTGLWIYSSNTVKVWNNTLASNGRTFSLWQDGRDTRGMKVHDIDVHNNVFAYGGNFCPMLLQDLREIWYGEDFDLETNGNYYHRRSATDPERYYCWANGADGTKSHRTLGAFQTATGQEQRGRLAEGSAILDSNWQTVSAVRDAEPEVALALPADVAVKMDQPAGLRRIGAVSLPLTAP